MKGILRYLRSGIDLFDRPQFRDTRVVKELHVDTAAELEEQAFWACKTYRLRIWIPADLLVLHGAFRYRGGWNPLVEALSAGEGSLDWYFNKFQQRSLQHMYLLPSHMPGADKSLWRYPWFGGKIAEGNGSARHGADVAASHMRRLNGTKDSILKHGYQPNRYGDIEGCLLKRGEEGRFLVLHGKHRAAALAAAGWSKIPVIFKLIFPRIIDETTAHSWPLVRSGVFDATTAKSIFNSYFDLDGRQQFSQVPRHESEKSGQ